MQSSTGSAYGQIVELVANGTIGARIDRTMARDGWPKVFALAWGNDRESKILSTAGKPA